MVEFAFCLSKWENIFFCLQIRQTHLEKCVVSPSDQKRFEEGKQFLPYTIHEAKVKASLTLKSII